MHPATHTRTLLSIMKGSILRALVFVAARQTSVEAFATSFLPTSCTHQGSRQHGVGRGGESSSAGSVHMFFGGPSGTMPKLYDGWFKKTQQIQKDIVAGAKSALRYVGGGWVC